ncbi:CDP-diacylglycerol--glycerol-3-phosphate 3-phosphatidyltransferase [Bifidobacterium vespertilionis]|uniref:CDP-diacylglycerol--glycerol-3-phosphate 3-phosphatidyltransferase n=1 Tax=Bifidobacterium vespertilionis TaxID=2562524 RepID=A0A5J5E3Q1_9BIFI|nr:CDP-diacylglycerol--glycerol-3-phosphate 3-phosphatidyltransferase [Bifidobacterium vespertilionis]KAA8823728.1 CDP-diacylglycerol--glycerol-3-phosphate 3-phosphatidyltransferase [Bifidobacterium vespertilionis]
MVSERETKKSLLDGWNSAPNLVTYARILLVVVFIVLLLMAGDHPTASMVSFDGAARIPAPTPDDHVALRWASCVVFLVAASTDKLDGWLARRTNAVTELGKLMDPIADKLLVLVALITLSAFGEVAWWITILFLVREIGITAMRFMVIDTGGKVIAAAWPGKLKTLFQSIALTMLLAPVWALGVSDANPEGLPVTLVHGYYVLAMAFLLVALVLCWYSGVEYVAKTVKAVRSASASPSDAPKEV